MLPDFYAISPKIVLDHFKAELLRQFHSQHHLDVPVNSLRIAAEDGTTVTLLAPGNALVADLIKAEQLLLHPGSSDCIITRVERLLPLPEGSCYRVRTDGPYAKVTPQEAIVLALHDAHAHLVEFLHAGQFLFEALDRTCFAQAQLCVDPAGRLYTTRHSHLAIHAASHPLP